jgi:hypothetical protein
MQTYDLEKKENILEQDKGGSVASDADKLAKPIMRAMCACKCMSAYVRARVCVCVCARARVCTCACSPVCALLSHRCCSGVHDAVLEQLLLKQA